MWQSRRSSWCRFGGALAKRFRWSGREWGGAAVVAVSGACASVRACVHALCHENCGGLVAAVVAFDSVDRRESFCRRTSKVKHMVKIEDSNDLVVVPTTHQSSCLGDH